MSILFNLFSLMKYEVPIDIMGGINSAAGNADEAASTLTSVKGDNFESTVIFCGIILLLGFFILRGFKKGFVQILISIFSMVAMMFVVTLFAPALSDYIIENTELCDAVEETILERIEDINLELDTENPTAQIKAIGYYDMPGFMKQALLDNNNEGVYEKLEVDFFEDYVTGFVARSIIKIASFVVCWLVVMIIVKATLLSMDFILNLPGLGSADKALGIVVGAVEGFMVIWMIMLFMIAVTDGAFYEIVERNTLALAIFDMNPLSRFMM